MRKHRPDLSLILFVLALMAASLIIVYAIGPRVAQSQNTLYGKSYSESYFFVHHAIAIGVSIIAMVAGYLCKYEWLGKFAKQLLIVSFVACLLVTIFAKLGVDALVTCDKGACRAFRIGSFGLMPSELLKIAVLFYMAWLIRDRKERKELDTKRFIVPFLTIMAAVALVLGVFEKDFGSTFVIAAMCYAMIFASGISMKTFGKLLLPIVAILGFLIVTQSYRLERIMDVTGGNEAYHTENSLIGMGTGGFFGVGLGNSIQATGWLPEAISDSIFSIICETWGYFGALLVILAFVAIGLRMLSVSQRTKDLDKRLFVVGVFTWIICHVIINIGGMTGILPMKGITLPFVSQGGTSMLFVAFAVGIVLQISGWTTRETVKENEDTSSRRGQRRARYARSSRRS
jgi:cell division protein FtsW